VTNNILHHGISKYWDKMGLVLDDYDDDDDDDDIASNGMEDECEDLELDGCGLFYGTIPARVWRD
jgi:hypothetical protein